MNDFSLTEINERISKSSSLVDNLKKGMSDVIIGQDELINKITLKLSNIYGCKYEGCRNIPTWKYYGNEHNEYCYNTFKKK